MASYQVLLRGSVQGQGIRPAIVRWAEELKLAGVVRNTVRGVEINVEGEESVLQRFLAELPRHLPAGCELRDCVWHPIPDQGVKGFRVDYESDERCESGQGTLATPVPRDRVVCADCLEDLFEEGNRRHQYAFASCTQCGPRLTIIQRMPFERHETAYQSFALCEACRNEYSNPASRRFHAQTQACPQCGPQVWAAGSDGQILQRNHGAVAIAAEALRRGEVVALRGLGGYQLLVDATSEEAVSRLRARKRRPAKPLAILAGSIAMLASVGEVSAVARKVLLDPSGPIVLIPARPAAGLASSIHPGLCDVGVMLPTTPLHRLLCEAFGKPLVCTSGNREGEPLEYRVEAAEHRLADIVDLWLHHTRSIVRPLDDSVVRIIRGKPTVLRLARGFAPLSLELATPHAIMALGGHMKVSLAWSNGQQAVLGPHVGDMETLDTRQRWQECFVDMLALYRFQPTVWVHDQHPDYFTTQQAELSMTKAATSDARLLTSWREVTPVISTPLADSVLPPASCLADRPAWAPRNPKVRLAAWHHHAHLASALLEPGWIDREVLGVVWDGTGYGTDGSIWGGEFLLGGVRGFQRLGSLRPFALPGGEVAVRQPWRTAIVLLEESFGPGAWREFASKWQPFATLSECEQLARIAANRRLVGKTTSAGRLFDALAMLALGQGRSEYEGQAAMHLEAAADESEESAYPMQLVSSDRVASDRSSSPLQASPRQRDDANPGRPTGRSGLELDWRPMVRAWRRDWERGLPPGQIAMRFHRGLAEGIVAFCQCWPTIPVVLTGGVFQNRLLTELVIDRLESLGQSWSTHGLIPPNDGGLAAGQLAIAAARLG